MEMALYGNREGIFGCWRCLARVLEMLVIPYKEASLTLVQGFSHCVRRHLNDPKVAGVGEKNLFPIPKRMAKKITLRLSAP